MTQEHLTAAVTEAERFLKRAKPLLKVKPDSWCFHIGKEIAAVKRSSLDLSRSLSVLRSSDYGPRT